MLAFLLLIALNIKAQRTHSDNGDGTYTNPIIFADYSDPDVIRVGEDFYMVSSSFNCTPAIPVLHSKDLMNWRIIGHVAENLPSTILGNSVLLRVAVDTGATCPFSFSNDSKTFKPLGLDFAAREGRWIGANVGIFGLAPDGAASFGFADYDWFRIE